MNFVLNLNLKVTNLSFRWPLKLSLFLILNTLLDNFQGQRTSDNDNSLKIEGIIMSKLTYVQDAVRSIVRMQNFDCHTWWSRDSVDKGFKGINVRWHCLWKWNLNRKKNNWQLWNVCLFYDTYMICCSWCKSLATVFGIFVCQWQQEIYFTLEYLCCACPFWPIEQYTCPLWPSYYVNGLLVAHLRSLECSPNQEATLWAMLNSLAASVICRPSSSFQ